MSTDNLPRHPLAYLDESFLTSEEARPLRILAEYLEPLERFRRLNVRDTIVFFGSARLTPDGPLGRYYGEARELARLITLWSKGLASHEHRYVVCSGGGGGIMEAANRGASEAGGRTVGLNISLPHEQHPNPYITRELSLEFHYFFMRKLWFAHLAQALVVFPGGFGTLDELMEMLTLAQTCKLERQVTVVLYGRAYWSEVINFDALVR
ncbi:MAG TPA: LOG family protein, partial [Steroidobacteraceae bacterium]